MAGFKRQSLLRKKKSTFLLSFIFLFLDQANNTIFIAFFSGFCDNIFSRKEKTRTHRLLNAIVLHQCIYESSLTFIFFNK